MNYFEVVKGLHFTLIDIVQRKYFENNDHASCYYPGNWKNWLSDR